MEIIRRIRIFLERVFSIHASTDKEGSIEVIRSGVEVRGYNGWLLVASSILACIGLDTNSDAVIIGAMLVSPLMSPILGLGLSFGINDRELFFRSLRNFGIAVGASLGVSIIYFLLTPLGETTPAILARTTPTTLDVLVAFFGGVAGIVAGSRKDKTNAIPGVAIATALMPPLCVSGYGLATAQPAVFLGAFYLFFINSVFIAFATFLIVRYLGFPFLTYPDEATRKKAVRYMAVFTIAIIIPSTVVMVSVIRELRYKKRVDEFVNTEIREKGFRVLDYELSDGDSTRELQVYLTGNYLPAEKKDSLIALIPVYRLDDLHLDLIQDLPPPNGLDISNKTRLEIMREIYPMITENHRKLDSLMSASGASRLDSGTAKQVFAEAQTLFPSLQSLILAERGQAAGAREPASVPVVIPEWKSTLRNPGAEERKLAAWIRVRMRWDTVVVARKTGK